MTSSKPYLIRALHEWITDNGFTPYVLINALMPGCELPEQHVKDGRIVFNISNDVIENATFGNEGIEFTARFSGIPTEIYLPTSSIVAIYAKENGEGMGFPEETPPENDGDAPPPPPRRRKGKPILKIVK